MAVAVQATGGDFATLKEVGGSGAVRAGRNYPGLQRRQNEIIT